jgi:hypothetical protein
LHEHAVEFDFADARATNSLLLSPDFSCASRVSPERQNRSSLVVGHSSGK